ncbi:MAG: (S)-ureidoglycine aminohydrolase [Pirellulaceae bacterium]|nr:(S)-ureidoglycine aminohydrolase [Pirellulaceae bacterium]
MSTSLNVFGSTRSSIERNHALITPDTHVRAPLVGWRNTEAIIHISPALGARFMQYTALMGAASGSDVLPDTVERFIYVTSGCVTLHSAATNQRHMLAEGHYAYLPAGSDWIAEAKQPANLAVFEKQFIPLKGSREAPPAVIGDASKVSSEPFMGDSDAQLKTLLPQDPQFDMAVNLFTFQPGATLPLVEIHVMEHGLLLLEGAGVYRLGDRYYPITAGDVIWMASYCPQWWVAMGKAPSTYLYYKDVYRDSLEDWR